MEQKAQVLYWHYWLTAPVCLHFHYGQPHFYKLHTIGRERSKRTLILDRVVTLNTFRSRKCLTQNLCYSWFGSQNCSLSTKMIKLIVMVPFPWVMSVNYSISKFMFGIGYQNRNPWFMYDIRTQHFDSSFLCHFNDFIEWIGTDIILHALSGNLDIWWLVVSKAYALQNELLDNLGSYQTYLLAIPINHWNLKAKL